MQIEITCRHAEIDETERAYALEKIGQLSHIWNRPLEARLIVEFEKYDYRIEINLHAGHSLISVTEKDRHFQAALDKAVRVTERRLRRLKGKTANESKRRRRLFVSEIRESAGEDDLPELSSMEDMEMPEMTRSMAVDAFKDSGRGFFVYYDLESGRTAIIYRRKNMALGVIEL
ncbi:MAG TPA: ribosome-associated translation inhibitor RaiA [bacterium]|nr:ribosome-associated translation inhibitor RaiA [bacterium]